MQRLLLRVLCAASIIVLGALPCLATDNAFQWWQPIYIEAPIFNPKYRAYVESNSRLNDNLNGMYQYILRGALGYRLRDNIEVFQGYTYQDTYVPKFFHENRSYQELGIGHVLFKRVDVLHRLRTEQRFFTNANGCANRMRYLLRFAAPYRNTRWYLVTYDELFVNLNGLDNGPTAGIDQNRLFSGIGRQINDKLRFEMGYQYQHVNRNNPDEDRAQHQLLTQTYINF